MDNEDYVLPEIVDYGSLSSVTESTGFTAEEDGGNKALLHHIPEPSQPAN